MTLGDVCEFEGGSQPPKSHFIYNEKPGYVRFLQIRDFGSDKNITYIPHSKKNRLCDESDILIGRYGASVGKILTGKTGAYNVALMKTIPNRKFLDQAWLYHFLVSDNFQKPLLNIADRSAQAGFSKDDINTFAVPVPSLPEQQRIVVKLDEAFAGLAKAKENAEKNLQNARALFESHLNEVFAKRGEGWEMKRLGDVLVKTETVDPTRTPQSEFDYIDVSSVSNQTLTIQETQRLKGMEAPSRARRLVRTNDVLFATIRPTLRRIAIVPENLDKQVCSTGYFVLRANSGTNHRIIFYFLQTEMFMASMERLQRGASYPAVTDSDIRSQNAFIPTLNEQKRLVTELDALSTETQRLEIIYKQKLDALETLKKSILHEAFSGNL